MKHLLALAVCLMMSGTMAVSADDLSWLQEDTEQMEATESLPSNMITFDFSNVRDPNEDLKITVTGSNVSSRKLKVYGIVKNISAEDYEDISFEASFLDKYDEEIKRNIIEIDSIPAGETVDFETEVERDDRIYQCRVDVLPENSEESAGEESVVEESDESGSIDKTGRIKKSSIYTSPLYPTPHGVVLTPSEYNPAAPDWTEYDNLITEIKSNIPADERVAKMHRAEDILMETGAVIPLYYYNDLYLQQTDVDGIYSNLFGFKYFQNAKLPRDVLKINLASEPAKLDG